MTTDQVDIFLEHFGKKGMKWGVRKEKSKTPLTNQQRAKRDQRRVKNVIVGLKVASAGLLVVTLLASSSGSRPVGPNLGGAGASAGRKAKSVNDVINSQRNVKITAMEKTFKEGFIDKEQLDNFKAILNKRYDLKIRDAMAG